MDILLGISLSYGSKGTHDLRHLLEVEPEHDLQTLSASGAAATAPKCQVHIAIRWSTRELEYDSKRRLNSLRNDVLTLQDRVDLYLLKDEEYRRVLDVQLRRALLTEEERHELKADPLKNLWNLVLGFDHIKSKSNLQPGLCIELEEWERDWAESERYMNERL
jgi:hypothetical protein